MRSIKKSWKVSARWTNRLNGNFALNTAVGAMLQPHFSAVSTAASRSGIAEHTAIRCLPIFAIRAMVMSPVWVCVDRGRHKLMVTGGLSRKSLSVTDLPHHPEPFWQWWIASDVVAMVVQQGSEGRGCRL